jgi:alanine dehydrogenase
MILERGYGERFGFSDARLAPLVGSLASREELLATADVVLLPKPQPQDLAELRDGQTLWGWPHCVQDRAITQLAIDKKLTLIAFEAMNHWASDGGFGLHVFHKNNELAGYCSVIHSLALTGSTGDYGRRLSAVVIGFGATARGAVTALNAHGIHDVQVLTNRGVAAVGSPIHSVRITQFDHDDQAPYLSQVITERGRVPLAPFLAESDIVVNCTLQDPNNPLTYLQADDLASFRPGSLIVDVSCDEGMGFSWAKTTTFTEPMFTVGDNIAYYAVDHSPSYLWNSASWEISEALLPFLETVMSGSAAWDGNETISRAIEIRDGVVLNEDVLKFQGRGPSHPHPVLAAS